MTKPKFDEGDLLMIEDATQALMALNDEHFRIIQQKQIDDEKSIAEWLDFLTVLDTYDRIRDTAVQKLRKGSWRNFGRRIAIWGEYNCNWLIYSHTNSWNHSSQLGALSWNR